MEKTEVEVKRFVLDPKSSFTDVISHVLGLFLDNRSAFYHINVRGDILSLEWQGFNTPPLRIVEFDMSKLEDSQKKEAIMVVYFDTFSFVGDLENRVTTIQKNWMADSHNGASHAFYHDRTGLWEEHKIADAVAKAYPKIFKSRKYL